MNSYMVLCLWTLPSVAIVGGPVLSLCGWDSQKCPCWDWRPLRPHWLLGHRHGRRMWSTHHLRKTVPQHTKAIIYIGTWEVHFEFPLEKVCLHFNSNYIIEEDPKKNRSRRRWRTHHPKKKNAGYGWADYEREVSRFKDRYPEEENAVKE